MNHHPNRIEPEQLCQRKAVLAVRTPVDFAITADVDTDLIGAMGQPRRVDGG